MREIVIWVSGYPPAKNEAESMLAAGHVHAGRVLALLRAASDKARPGDTPIYFSHESPGLELIVTGPGQPPSDAASYLGGAAGVLEDKQHRGDLLRGRAGAAGSCCVREAG